MAGYIGSKASVTQVDGYNRTEADSEFVQVAGDTMTGDLNVTGTLEVDNVTDGTTSVPTSYVVNGSAKAWLNLNGTGVIDIRGSLNVASVTDNAVGVYTENFSSAFAEADYSVGAFTGGNGSVRSVVGGPTAFTTTSSQLIVTNSAEAVADAEIVTASTHGDLA